MTYSYDPLTYCITDRIITVIIIDIGHWPKWQEKWPMTNENSESLQWIIDTDNEMDKYKWQYSQTMTNEIDNDIMTKMAWEGQYNENINVLILTNNECSINIIIEWQ